MQQRGWATSVCHSFRGGYGDHIWIITMFPAQSPFGFGCHIAFYLPPTTDTLPKEATTIAVAMALTSWSQPPNAIEWLQAIQQPSCRWVAGALPFGSSGVIGVRCPAHELFNMVFIAQCSNFPHCCQRNQNEHYFDIVVKHQTKKIIHEEHVWANEYDGHSSRIFIRADVA